MKSFLFLLVTAAGIVGVTAQTAVLSYNFNDTGTTTASSGSDTSAMSFLGGAARGAAGSGVSGAATDYAFDNSASAGMGSGFTGGRAQTSGNATSLNNLTSFTISGWFDGEGTELSNNARLLDFYNPGTSTGFYLVAGSTAGSLELVVNSANRQTTGGYTSTDWQYFAVTYDSASSTVIFYAGTKSSSVTQIGSFTLAGGILGNPASGLALGDNLGGTVRPVDGLMDDVSIYSGILNSSQLETIRQSNLAVPEPSAMALLALGAVAAAGVAVRRRALLG